MKIKTKILLISFLPILFLGAFFYSKIKELNKDISNLLKLESYSNVLIKSSNLIHELQKERGLSSLFLSNDGKKYKNEIFGQRFNTDKKLQDLEIYLQKISNEKLNHDSIIISYFYKLTTNYKNQILQNRSFVNSFNKKPEEIIELYSTIIKNISNYSTEVVVMNKSSNIELDNLKISYLNLFHLKEISGKERAFISSILSKNSIDKQKLIKLAKIIGNKKIHEDFLDSFLTNELEKKFNEILTPRQKIK